MSDWVSKPLGEIIALQRGHDLPSQYRKEGGIPIMGSSGITGYHNEVKMNGPGVVVGRSGNSMGEVSLTEVDYWPLNTCLYVTDFKGNDEHYIYYLLQTINFDQFNSGSAQKSLNRNAVYPYEVRITENKNEQVKIGRVLADLEDKIELNRQINQTLEQIAQAIFKSWFVDFEPVKAKIQAKKNGQNPERAAMCAISGKSLEELEQLSPENQQQLKTTAALFPDTLVESELGEIPEGWSASKLGDHFNVVMGQSPKGDTYNEEGDGTLFFQGRRDFGFRFPTPRVYTTEPKRFAQAGDTLISVRAPVGDKNLALEECCLGRGVAGIRHKSGFRSFTYAFISHIERNLSNSGSDGTVFNSINKNELNAVPFVAPSDEIIIFFENMMFSLDQRVEVLSKEIDSLENLRDIMLLKLLSGEIVIEANQAKLEAVV